MPLRAPIRTALLSCTLALASACAEGATARGMTVTPADLKGPASPSVSSSVGVGKVSGGKETNPAWKSNIDNGPFMDALRESLRLAGLLSDRPDAPLSVDAALVSVDSPTFGFDLTVTSVVRYTVREARTGAVVIDEEIRATHTATVSDAFYGPTRLQLANEGSARKNIALLVQRLNTIRKNAPAPAAPPPATAPAVPST